MKNLLILTVVSFTLLNVLFAQNYIYDESYKDPSFVDFKMQLTNAILNQDTNILFPLLAKTVNLDDIECSHASSECFKNRFRKNRYNTKIIWKSLYDLVAFGFSRTEVKNELYSVADIVYQAPSYQKQSSGEYLVVLGKNVNIRAQPTTRSSIVAQCSFERLKYNNPITSQSTTANNVIDGKVWFEVLLTNGKVGYLVEDYASARIEKELSVRKINGKWKIISYYHPTPKC